MSRLVALYRKVVELLERLAWIPLLVARVGIGLEFFLSGKGKLAKLPELTEYFKALGIPAPAFNATFTASTELVCGALLVPGIATRFAAAPLAIVMTVAIFTAQIKTVKEPFLSNFLYLSEWSFLVIFVWLIFTGGGKASVDHLIAKRVLGPSTKTA